MNKYVASSDLALKLYNDRRISPDVFNAIQEHIDKLPPLRLVGEVDLLDALVSARARFRVKHGEEALTHVYASDLDDEIRAAINALFDKRVTPWGRV